jgi:hypothetical protein
MWLWGTKRSKDEFPDEFRVQQINVSAAMAVAELPPAEIANHFRKHPEAAQHLLDESYDKRYSPSSFLSEETSGFIVGWCPRNGGYEYVRRFTNLADAATDYLLFSLGKGRWAEPSQ